MEILLLVLLVVAFLLPVGRLVSMKLSKSVTGLLTGSGSLSVSDNVGIEANPTVLQARTGVLTTRTNNTSGSLTMTAGHGIVTGQRVDLYWTGGHCYGAVVGTVSVNVVPIASVSGGDNLPIATTAITVGICKTCPFPFTGDNLTALACSTKKDGYFVFADGSADIVGEFVSANDVFAWFTGDTGTNPLAGEVPTKVYMSHSDTSGPNSNMAAAAIVH